MLFRQGFGHGQALIARNPIEIGTNGRGVGNNPRFLRSFASILILATLSVLPTSAFAQIDEAATIKIGESNFTPEVRFEFRQTNNAFLTGAEQADADQTEATAFVIKPRAKWAADRRLLTLTGIYEGQYASYSETALNYADHSLRGIIDAEVSTRQRVRARLGFNYGHEALGTNFTRGNTNPNATQVEFLSTELAGFYSFGAKQARGNLNLGLVLSARSYQNQQNLTRGSDYTSVRPYGQFSLRLSADTRAIATLRFSSLDYDDNFRDRNDISLLAGLRFAATGKSGGEFQLGTSLTNFSQATRTDVSSFVAEAELFYEPSVFSRFELTGARALDNDAGSPLNSNTVLTITDNVRLNWVHQWSSRFYHVANLSYRVKNGDCPARAAVADGSGSIEMNLVIQRWLHVGASIRGQSRESTLCDTVNPVDVDSSYESQIIGGHIRATL